MIFICIGIFRITLLLKHANISADEFRFGDIDEKFDFLVEANDDMLERIVCFVFNINEICCFLSLNLICLFYSGTSIG
jgi:hypothetical protein